MRSIFKRQWNDAYYWRLHEERIYIKVNIVMMISDVWRGFMSSHTINFIYILLFTCDIYMNWITVNCFRFIVGKYCHTFTIIKLIETSQALKQTTVIKDYSGMWHFFCYCLLLFCIICICANFSGFIVCSSNVKERCFLIFSTNLESTYNNNFGVL